MTIADEKHQARQGEMRPALEVFVAGGGGKNKLNLALKDLYQGLRQWRLWTTLGWKDLRLRYRRSVLGPLWLTLSMAIMVAAFGFVYGVLFNIPLSEYLPYLALGLISWGFISGTISDGCNVFLAVGDTIKQMKLPYSVHVFRIVWRNIIIYCHNFIIFVIVALIFGLQFNLEMLWIFPAYLLLVWTSIWILILLGIICSRYRDVPPIVLSLLQVSFLATPILWKADRLTGDRYFIVAGNPFYHFIDIVRSPLLGQQPAMFSWIAALVFTAVGTLVCFLVFVQFRNRISYWL